MSYIDHNNNHYSDRIAAELLARGWHWKDSRTLYKRFHNVAPAGVESDGSRIVYARFCDRFRYLQGSAGWDRFDIDGRSYAEHDMYERAARDFDDMACTYIAR